MGKLVQVDSVTVSGTVSTIEVGGANWDSSFDTYMVTVNALQSNTDSVNVYFRILDSSNNPISTADYKFASRNVFGQTAAGTGGANGFTYVVLSNNSFTNNDTFSSNAIFYLYNFNAVAEPSYIVFNIASRRTLNNELVGQSGGAYLVAGQHKGIRIYATNNLTAGKATLYGVV